MEAQAAKNRGARPRRPVGGGYSAHVMVKLTPAQRQALAALATDEGHCALSVYARQILLAHVAERHRAGTP